ncbi:MAG: DNA adenine methylase, partial [Ignavibacteria bacterium]|nr:DNA adenine methylase [Ignavibacteria bacterium]
EPEQFIEKIEQTQVNIDNWRKQKFILRDSDKDHKYSELELGFAAFFLNRCNRSGIITNSVGPIGGKNQDGKWKVDARYNKRELIQKIEILKSMKGNIVISNEDAVLMMKKIDTPISKTLIYIDPPYFQHGPQLYRCYFTKKDHLRLAEYVQNDLKYDWIVSYDDDEYIRNIYHNQNISPIILNHRAQKQHIENELIIQRP